MNNPHRNWIAVAVVAIFVAGCDLLPFDDIEIDDDQPPPAVDQPYEDPGDEAAEDEPEQTDDGDLVDQARELAQLRKQIEDDPDSVDELLEDAELTEQELEELMFEIAEDPTARSAYTEEL